MNTPLHLYASAPVGLPASQVHDRLTSSPQTLVTTATAQGLEISDVSARMWGLRTRSLPTITADVVDDDELGSVRLRWGGDEETTGWPAMAAWLVIVPTSASSSRLALVSPRSPRAEIPTVRVDRLHRQRVVVLAVRAFVHALAEHLETFVPPSAHASSLTGAGASAGPTFDPSGASR